MQIYALDLYHHSGLPGLLIPDRPLDDLVKLVCYTRPNFYSVIHDEPVAVCRF